MLLLISVHPDLSSSVMQYYGTRVALLLLFGLWSCQYGVKVRVIHVVEALIVLQPEGLLFF